MRRPRTPSRTRRARSASGSSGRGFQQLVGVQLVHLDGALRRGADAHRAEDALVDVALDDVDLPAGVGVDVDRADLRELCGELRVAGDGVVDLDADEDGVATHWPWLPACSS